MNETRFDPAEWDTIAEYLSGMMTTEERDAFEMRLRLEPALQCLISRTEESLVLLGDGQRREGDAPHREGARARLLERVHRKPHQAVVKTSRQRWYWGVAGAVSVGLLVMVGVGTMMPDGGHVAETVVETDIGEHVTLVLEDGAQVRLGPDSRLHYTVSAHETMVTLSGEAFFTVHPKADRSFSVSAGDIRTRVLGTSFQVRRFAADSVTHVAVTEGKVAVESVLPVALSQTRRHVVLSAGMMAWAGDSIVVAPSGARDAVQWVDGRLTFTRAPVPVILETLGRWYGYQFRLADSVLATRHATVAFEIGKPSDVMHTLRTVLDVRPDIDGNIVTLYTDRPSTQRPPAKRLRDTLIHSTREVGK